VRAAVLSQLAEAPSNGYGLIRSISDRTNGAWTPSPGSIYPTLAQLVDEGLVEPASGDPGADFQLTAEGRSHVAEQAERLDRAWHLAEEDSAGLAELRAATTALLGAVEQVRIGATPEQVVAATGQLHQLRRSLFALLAEDPAADAGSSGVGR
jgi:DNA-binding PadR family transcriptional regulator